MSGQIPGNHKHLTLDDRIYIEKCLDSDICFKDIAKFLCKDPTSISKEVKKHRFLKRETPLGAIILTNAFTGSHVTCIMCAAELYRVTSSAVTVMPATHVAANLKSKYVTVSSMPRLSVMDVLIEYIADIQNTCTVLLQPTGNTKPCYPHQERESIYQKQT